MYQYDMSVYILSIVVLAIAVERFTEFFNNSKLFGPVRSCIFSIYASLATTKVELCQTNKIRAILLIPVKITVLIVSIILLIIFWFLQSILSCGWCLSGQLSILASFLMPGGLFGLNVFDNILVKIGVIWGISNYIHTTYEVFRRGRIKYHELTIKDDDNSDHDDNIEVED